MSGCDSTQLTTDGVQYWSYGLADPRPSELQRPQPRRPQIRWSPDSKKLVVYRTDERNVAQMPYISYTPQRPKMYTQPYALPGDTIVPLPGFHIIDVATKSNVAVNVLPRPSQLTVTGSSRDSAWSVGSDKLYVTWITRASKSAYLASVDANTGAYHVIARDSTKTFVEIGPPVGGSGELVRHQGQSGCLLVVGARRVGAPLPARCRWRGAGGAGRSAGRVNG